MCLGVPGKITEVEEGLMRMGVVDFDGSSLKVCLAYVPEAAVGDYVLVHAGFALAVMTPVSGSTTYYAVSVGTGQVTAVGIPSVEITGARLGI